MDLYVVDTSLDGKVRIFGKGGEPFDLSPGDAYYDASEVNRFVAENNAFIAAKDRDLADANHALLLANNSADAFRRVAEQRQGEIERLRRALRSTVEAIRESIRTGISLNNRDFDQVGADALSVLAMCGNGVTNHPHLICELYEGHHGLCGTDDDAAEKPTTGASNAKV